MADKGSDDARSEARISFTVVRNEAPYLLEWIAYQRVIGFDRVVVYTNNCSDQTVPLCQALAAAGEIEHVDFDPQNMSPQGVGIWMFSRSATARPGDWVLFSDPDEFLVIKFGKRNLDSLIQRIGSDLGVLINWRLFGDGGKTEYQGITVSDSYRFAAKEENFDNRVLKSLVRLGPEIKLLGVHTPQLNSCYGSTGRRLLSSRLTPIDFALPSYHNLAGGGEIVTCDASDSSYDLMQLNHYFVRSPASYAIKAARGEGGFSVKQAQERGERYTSAIYAAKNRNDVEDRNILAHSRNLDVVMEKYLRLPNVAEIQEKIDASFAQLQARGGEPLSEDHVMR